MVAHEADHTAVVAHRRVVGRVDGEGFHQGAGAVLLQEELESAEVGAGFDVFAEGQHQVVAQAHGGGIGHHVATCDSDEVAVSAEVNRAVDGAQTRDIVAIEV